MSFILQGTTSVSGGGTGSSSLALNNVLLGNGTSPLQVVAPGTTGNVLQSDGTTWKSAVAATPPSGMTFLASASGSYFTVLSLDYDMTNTYNMYVVIGTNFAFQDYYSEVPYMRMKLNGSYATSGYTGMETTTTNKAGLFNTSPGATSPSYAYNFVWWIPTPYNTNYKGRVIYSQYWVSNQGSGNTLLQGGLLNSAAAGSNALTGVQIVASSVLYATGTMALYGISKS